MRLRFVSIVTTIMIIISAGIGLYNKSMYTDFNFQENPLEEVKVAILPDDLLEIQIEHLRKNLEHTSNYIVAVECMEKSLFRFHCTSQEVVVKRVFKGKGLSENDSIEIVKAGTEIFRDAGKSSVNMGFVNEMRPGKAYLVFLDRKIENTERIYIQSDEFIIAPIFCYEDIVNIPYQPDNLDYTVTDYINVKDNEFFFMSESSYEIMRKFKADLFQRYNHITASS